MATSPASPTAVAPVPAPSEGRTGELPQVSGCDVCEHAAEGHDAIAERFCRATQARVLTRACICRSGGATLS